MNSNILEKDFILFDEAINYINQIKKTSIIFKDVSEKWKILILENKESIFDDLESFDISEEDYFIIISDNLGNIKRKKVQLTYDDTSFFTRIISNFKKNNFFLNKKLDILNDLNSFISKEEIPNNDNKILSKTKLISSELYCYFKTFIPSSITIEPIIDDKDNIERLYLYLEINDNKSLNVLEPLFRKNNIDNSSIDINLSIKLILKDKILKLIKDELYQKGLLNSMMIKNPLGKGILNNLDNYDIEDISKK